MISLKRAGFFFILFFFFLFNNAFGQDKRVSDSLLNILKVKANLTDKEKLDIYHDIAYYHTNPDSAIIFSDLLIDLARKYSDSIYVFRGYAQKGYSLLFKGEFDKAVSLFFNCAYIAEAIKDKYREAAAYISLGDAYSKAENHKNSILYFNKAISLSRKINDTVLLANALFNSANEYLISNSFDTALIYFNEAGKIYELIDNKFYKAYVMGNKGMLFNNIGNEKEAESNLRRAIEILGPFGDKYSISSYTNALAKIYLGQKAYEKALRYSILSYNLSREAGLKQNISETCSLLSKIYYEKGDIKNAYKFQSEYYGIRDSLLNNKTITRIADLRTEYEVSKKQAEVDYLKKTRKAQSVITISLLIILILTVALVLILLKNYKRKKALNHLLLEQKEELLVQQEQLEEHNRTKDRFFSIISHDLRGPIAAIGNFPELLVHYAENNTKEDLQEMVNLIETSVKKVSVMLDNLLEWALSQQGTFPFHPEKLNVCKILKEVKPIFVTMAGIKNLSIEEDVNGEIYIMADKNSLITIIRNLINNSIKFTKPGGQICISAKTNHTSAIIEIKDSGIGIPKEKLENIFSIYEKKSTWGTNKEKGLGIGLSLVHDFVKMNNGEIAVTSEPGKGSSFSIYFPIHND